MIVTPSPTTLEREQDIQRQWKLRENMKHWQPQFDEMVSNEFIAPELHQDGQLKLLQAVLSFAEKYVPYYQKVLQERALTANDFQSLTDLQKLPVLDRALLQEHDAEMQATHLPEGHQRVSKTQSSGTSGQPVSISRTLQSLFVVNFISQREGRWFRLNPNKNLAVILNNCYLTHNLDLEAFKPNQSITTPSWTFLGQFYETGPCALLADNTAIEDQAQWLLEQQPCYLLAAAASLEHLALEFQEQQIPSIEGIMSIAQQLTSQMRQRIETTFNQTVEQNYGLNEVGYIAIRCCYDRYHVHSEYYLTEIVDDQGQLCPPGVSGRLLVTALNNPAMPLIRYDSGDYATACDNTPCPCGRTMPAFEKIQGRFRRMLNCPPNTWQYWDAILNALVNADSRFIKNIRQYQLHQFLNNSYELRFVSKTALPPAFLQTLRHAWQSATNEDPVAQLAIIRVDEICRPVSGKFQSFTSDHAPMNYDS